MNNLVPGIKNTSVKSREGFLWVRGGVGMSQKVMLMDSIYELICLEEREGRVWAHNKKQHLCRVTGTYSTYTVFCTSIYIHTPVPRSTPVHLRLPTRSVTSCM